MIEPIVQQEPYVQRVDGFPLTQRMIDNLIFMQVHQEYRFELIQRLFYISHGVEITPVIFAKTISAFGLGFSLLKTADAVVYMDGKCLTQRMLDDIVFMHSNRKFHWDTIRRFFRLTHGFYISDRLIYGVLRYHDFRVNGPVHRHKLHMGDLISREPLQFSYTKSEPDTHQEEVKASRNKEGPRPFHEKPKSKGIEWPKPFKGMKYLKAIIPPPLIRTLRLGLPTLTKEQEEDAEEWVAAQNPKHDKADDVYAEYGTWNKEMVLMHDPYTGLPYPKEKQFAPAMRYNHGNFVMGFVSNIRRW
jgi:hypothetical protein